MLKQQNEAPSCHFPLLHVWAQACSHLCLLFCPSWSIEKLHEVSSTAASQNTPAYLGKNKKCAHTQRNGSNLQMCPAECRLQVETWSWDETGLQVHSRLLLIRRVSRFTLVTIAIILTQCGTWWGVWLPVDKANGGLEGRSVARQEVRNSRVEMVEREGTAAPGVTPQLWFS